MSIIYSDDAFFQPNWAGACGVVGLDQDLWRVEPEDTGSSGLLRIAARLIGGLLIKAPLCKKKEEGGRRGLGPWPLRCLSQFLSERKERLLRLLSISVQIFAYLFTVGVAMYL